MTSPGRRIRERREALGLTLEELARRTRIGQEHLVAIEEDRPEDLPPGPYSRAWTRSVHEALELDEVIEEVEVEPEPWVPLGVVRIVGLVSAFAVIGLVAWLRWGRLPLGGDPTLVAAVPDLHVGVTARRTVVVRVVVDGEPAFEGELAGGDARAFEAFDRIDLEVPSVDAVRLTHDGATVVPQGRQDAPRRIAFIDDEGS